MFESGKRLPWAVGAAALLAISAGCGSDDSDADTDAAETVAAETDAAVTVAADATTAPSASEGAPDESSGDPVIVEASDYKFDAIPDEFPSGTQLTLTNTSAKELHELVAFRIPDAETRPVAELMALPEEELGALFAGEPATVIIAPPESDGFPAVGTGIISEPGRYAFVCFIPTGADPEEYMAAAEASTGGPPDVAGGPPHFVNGMFAEATVT